MDLVCVQCGHVRVCAGVQVHQDGSGPRPSRVHRWRYHSILWSEQRGEGCTGEGR